MTFTTPEWFFILVCVPLVIALGILAWRKRDQRWQSIVAKRLKTRLARTRSAKRHFTALGLSMIGFFFMVVAIAMPENGEEFIETRQEGRNILLCIDISQSMLTLDSGAGSRLTAAKAAALEITERFPLDRIGLVIFSGESQLMVPLTIDHSYLNESISQLDPIDLVIGGSDLAQAINESTNILNETGQRNNVLVVMSDGEDHSSGIETAAARAADRGVFIYALGFGSEEGDFIQDPRNRDGYFYDRNGNRVFSQLKQESLRRIADQTEGVYTRATGGNFLLSLEKAVSKMDRFEDEGGHQRIAKPIYQWFLLPSILFLVSAFILQRLPVPSPAATAMGTILFTLFSPFESYAQTSAPLDAAITSNILEDAQEKGKSTPLLEVPVSVKALEYAQAAQKTIGDRQASYYMAAGAADYQEKNWALAAQSFGQAVLAGNETLRQQAHAALASSLFHQGCEQKGEERLKSWSDAISHFGDALTIQEDQATRENYEFLEKLLKQQQEQQKEQEEKSEGQEQNDQNDSQNEQGEEQNQQKEEQGSDQKSDNQNESPQNPQKNTPRQEQPDPSGSPPDDEEPNGEPDSQSDQQNQENNQGQKAPSGEQGEEKEGELSQAQGEPDDSEETPIERARRILREQVDFGGKPPRARRRAFRRPEKDW